MMSAMMRWEGRGCMEGDLCHLGAGRTKGDNDPSLISFDFVGILCYKDNHITNDHIQAKGIPFKSGADPPL